MAVEPGTSFDTTGKPPASGRWLVVLVPVAVTVLLLVITFLLYSDEWRAANRETQAQSDLIVGQLARRLELVLSQQLAHAVQLRDYIESGRISEPLRFFVAARLMQQNAAMFEQALWIDADGTCRGAFPEGAQLRYLGRKFDPGVEWAIISSVSVNKPLVVEAPSSGAAPGTQQVAAWIASAKEPVKGLGVLLARADLRRGIGDALDLPTLNWVALEVEDDHGRVLFGDERAGSDSPGSPCRAGMKIMDETWTLTGWPTTELRTRVASRVRPYTPIIGTLLSLLTGYGAFQLLQNRRRWEALRATHARALQSLNEISAETLLGEEPYSRTLARLTRIFADALGCKTSILLLCKSRQDEMLRVHQHGLDWDVGPARVPMSIMPITRECFATGQDYVIEDADKDSGLFKPGFLQERGVRSFMILPLMVGDKPIGSIQLADPKPHRIGQAERKMAQVWAAHAAVLVSHRRLLRKVLRNNRRRQRLLSQTKRLYEVSEAIFRATTLQGTFDRICELGPKAIGMDYCSVNLCHQMPNQVRLCATTHRDREQTVGRVFDISGYHAEDVMRDKTVVACPRVLEDPKVYKAVRHILGTEGVIYAPLCGTADGPAFGYVVFGKQLGGPFAPIQLRLARIFADRAAAAIEIARYHEESVRDAAQRQTLLRELNHRVKNNLAGIVGLLSTHPSDLAPDSRRWLDRVTDRISTMARVHELFVQGDHQVRLSTLVSQIIESLEFLRGPEIVVEMDFSSSDILLEPDRAVTLAIVLNELSYNAIVHGLCDGGTLRIASRTPSAGRVAIEVTDESPRGSGRAVFVDAGATVAERRSTRVDGPPGVGLNLVRGLVGRELQGIFTLEGRGECTTAATIEFSE